MQLPSIKELNKFERNEVKDVCDSWTPEIQVKNTKTQDITQVLEQLMNYQIFLTLNCPKKNLMELLERDYIMVKK